MLDANFWKTLAATHDLEIIDIKPLSGGDINEVYLLNTTRGFIVIKLNTATTFPNMFEAETKGLKTLKASKSFKIPDTIGNGTISNRAYLLLDYIKTSNPQKQFWQNFAECLAKLHKATATQFGLEYSNYIGSLPQYNSYCDTASEFYITQRLEPQIKLASKNGYRFSGIQGFLTNISRLIPEEQPALIHGDLWRGNYLVSSENNPVLIDPAIAFSIREMDLAMMQLFGGFPPEVFSMYNEIFPLKADWQQRIKLFQLYYVLAHVNLFGGGYYTQANSILKMYQ